MTANHDTPEAVEAMAVDLKSASLFQSYEDALEDNNKAADMLRRLHQRAVDAERERDQWITNSRETELIAESKMRQLYAVTSAKAIHYQKEASRLRASLATARADTLREAAKTTRYVADRNLPAGDAERAILALINQSTTGET